MLKVTVTREHLTLPCRVAALHVSNPVCCNTCIKMLAELQTSYPVDKFELVLVTNLIICKNFSLCGCLISQILIICKITLSNALLTD